MTKEGLLKVMSLAKADRQAGKQVLIVNMKKNKSSRKNSLLKTVIQKSWTVMQIPWKIYKIYRKQ